MWWYFYNSYFFKTHESMHLYSLRSSSLSDWLFSFLIFLYSNSAASKYYDRIYSCMNHLTSHTAFSELSISFLISSYSVYEFCRAVWHSVNLLQCAITCSAVSLAWLHKQTNDKKLRMQILFRKAASSMWFVQIYVIIKFSVFYSCACSLTALQLKNLISRKFHLKNLSVQ